LDCFRHLNKRNADVLALSPQSSRLAAAGGVMKSHFPTPRPWRSRTTEGKISSMRSTFQFRSLDLQTARLFIETWHYSKRVPTGRNIFFGWFADGELYAVADFGIGVNPRQERFLSQLTGKLVSKANLVELKRLCRTDPRRQPLTQFLSLCHRALKKQGVRFVVAFSDPAFNPLPEKIGSTPYDSGGLYKAANFQYLGKTLPERHVIDRAGGIHHRRVAHRFMKRANAQREVEGRRKMMTLPEARKVLGFVPIITMPKDRWFIDLGR
jgi:hypothetical protein